MPKYLLQASYTVEGIRGVLKEGATARRAAVDQLVKDLGGSVESFHFAFGEKDVFVIAELPDNKTAAAIATAVSASGAVSVSTTVLISPEEMDDALQISVNYRPPGA